MGLPVGLSTLMHSALGMVCSFTPPNTGSGRSDSQEVGTGGWPEMLSTQDKNTQLINQAAGSSTRQGHTEMRAYSPGVLP